MFCTFSKKATYEGNHLCCLSNFRTNLVYNNCISQGVRIKSAFHEHIFWLTCLLQSANFSQTSYFCTRLIYFLSSLPANI